MFPPKGRDWLFIGENVAIIQADCDDILPSIDPVDLCLTDPPFGIGISSNPVRQKHQKKDWDEKPASKDQIRKIIHKSNEQIIWGGNYFGLPESRGYFVWDKMQPENFSLAMCEMAWWSKNSNAKIFRKSVTSYAKKHPTQKPVELMVWCIQQTKANVVLDPFMGSGTTGVACVILGKKFIGIEKDPHYFKIAKERLENEVTQPMLPFQEPVEEVAQPNIFDEIF